MEEYIYCLMMNGKPLNDEISDFLFENAQEILKNKRRKKRLRLEHIELIGEISTEYKVGFIGALAGIIFAATIDWEGGSTKTSFIVRSTAHLEKPYGLRGWIRQPLFPQKDISLN